jgi:hypothetical protein
MAKAAPFNLPRAWLNAFEADERINQYLLEDISAAAWHVEAAGDQGRRWPPSLLTCTIACDVVEGRSQAWNAVIRSTLEGEAV